MTDGERIICGGYPDTITMGCWFGPMIICHVRCNRCGTTYNGNSGDSNNTRIAIFYAVQIGIVLTLTVATATGACCGQ